MHVAARRTPPPRHPINDLTRMPTDAHAVTAPAGDGGLPKVALAAADGARFEVYLHGAHVTSWRPAGERRRTPVRERDCRRSRRASRSAAACRSAFRNSPTRARCRCTASRARRRGRSSRRTALPTARRMRGCASSIRAATRAALAARVRAASYAVDAPGATLDARACRRPTPAPTPFAFTAALHTYLRVADVRAVRVRGLTDAHYRDKVLKPRRRRRGRRRSSPSTGRSIASTTPSPRSAWWREPQRAFAIRATGTTDTVVWNPGPSTATAADLDRRTAGARSCASKPPSRARSDPRRRLSQRSGVGTPDR